MDVRLPWPDRTCNPWAHITSPARGKAVESQARGSCTPIDNYIHMKFKLNSAPASQSSGRFSPADINIHVFLKLKFPETPALLCLHAA